MRTALLLAGAILLHAGSARGANVLTQHNDLNRTGGNTSELTLTTGNVNASQFGKLWQYAVDGHVYAQPLVAQGVATSSGVRNVLYIATMHNTVYAFDADGATTTPLWSVSLGTPVPLPDPSIGTNCGSYRDIFYEIGILSTPVIDLGSNTIYVAAKTTGYVDRLWALDLGTGASKMGGPVTLGANLNGRTLQGQYANQRSGLVLANGRVHVGFGGYCDTGTYYGWYLGYAANNLAAAPIVFNAARDGSAAPVWMSGGAAPVDAAGNLYVMTGNGTFNANSGGSSYGQSFLKLSPSLAVLDWFTPFNYAALNSADVDLGSSNPLLVPGTSTLIGGGKEGKLYLVNANGMGHYNAGSDAQIPQSLKVATGHIHGAPVYYAGPTGNLVYVMAETDALKGFQLTNGLLNTTPVTQSIVRAPAGSMPGGVLSVSANGTVAGTGIVWDSMPVISDANQGLAFGILRAFDATNLTRELWNSQQNPARDANGLLAKFSPPTIANGRVYMSSFSKQVAVYGLLGSVATPAPTPTPTVPASGNLALGKWAAGSVPCSQSEGPSKAVNGSVAGGNSDKFCSNQGSLHLIVDLGGTYSIGSVTVRHAGAGGESTSFNTRDFNIQLSPDLAAWTTVATVTGNTASVTTHPIAATSARYVRLNVTTGGATARIYELEVYAATGATATATATATTRATPTSTTSGQTAYGGTNGAIANGSMIQAENYDLGGSGVAYSDTTAANTGGQYRTDDVDIEACTDTGGGYNVGWLIQGEWLEYTVNATAGTYTITARVASAGAAVGDLRVLLDGVVLGTIPVNATGGWQTYADASLAGIVIPGGGNKVLRLEVVNGGDFNVNYVRFASTGATATATSTATATATATPTPNGQSPYGGANGTIASGSTIQAENYDLGGSGVAYSDTTTGNTGGQFRSDNVDLEACTDAGGGYNIGWLIQGEWLEYTVNATAGTYTITARVASNGAAVGDLRVLLDGAVLGTISVNATGGWQTYTDSSVSGITIPGGNNKVLRLEVVNGGDFNVNHVRFSIP